MRHLPLLLILAVIGLLTACNPHALDPTAAEDPSGPDLEMLEQKEAEAEARIAEHEAQILNHPNYQDFAGKNATATVYLQAGSVDGLQAAIDQAGPWGKVVVKTGLHIENQTVNITHPVRVIGQPGAIIQSNVVPTVDFSGFPAIPPTFSPALFIDDANFVQVMNLTFVPDPTRGYGELAIGVNESDYAYIYGNDFQHFDCVMFAREAGHMLALRNTAEGVASDGLGPFGLGFLHASGSYPAYVRNTLNDFGIAQFFCDANGLAFRNKGSNSYDNMILCKWPTVFSQFPNGDVVAAASTAVNWLVASNQANSCAVGYRVTDGATNNLLISNQATNSTFYDALFRTSIQDPLLGLLPAAFNNTYIGGRYPGQLVKDCGDNNTIIGAILVDIAVDTCGTDI